MTELPTREEFRVLHTLRIGGATSRSRLATMLGDIVDDPVEDVEDVLLALASRGLVGHESGAFSAWSLTPAGREADATAVAAELAATGAEPAVRAAHDRFGDLNRAVLETCTAWQVRRTEPVLELNDHADPAYDVEVLDRLWTVHDRAAPLLDELATALERFGHHRPRLARALEAALAGDRGQVTNDVDSYHATWFQLHEDLLTTLSRSRTDEPTP